MFMSENRTRNWFLTINKEASCFTELKTILVNNGSTFKHYAYIVTLPELTRASLSSMP